MPVSMFFRFPWRVSAFVLLAAGAPVSLLAQAEPLAVTLRWQPGHTYTQETTTETVTVLTAIGQAADQKMNVKQTTTVAVTPADRGQKEARVTFASLSGEMLVQGQKLAFDSAQMDAAPPLIRESLGKSVGATFVLVYGENDQFLRVRDAGSMVGANGGNPSLEVIAEAQEVAELYRRSLEMGLPKMKVKPGDRWTSQETVKFPSAGTVNSEMRARFDAIVDYEGRRHAKISFEGDLKGSGQESAAGVALGTGSKTFGQILFDLDRATISFSAFRAEIQLEVAGKSLPVRQQVTTKLVSVEPPL